MPLDRHASDIEALRRDVLSSAGATERAHRARVLAGDSPRDFHEYLEKVRSASHRVTDDDVAALRRAGFSEDEIFELTVAAALGVALERHGAARIALEESR